jgi:vancomycin resistance protein YoaR
MSSGIRWGAGSFAGCVAVGSLALAIQAQPKAARTGVVPEHVALGGVQVGGKSAEEVEKIARELSARLLALPVTVRYAKRSTQTSPTKLGATVDVQAAVDAALTPEPDGSLLDRIRERFTGPDGREIPLMVKVPETGVAEGLKRFSALVGIEPKEARLTKVKGKFKATPPKPGKELDSADLAEKLQTALDAEELRTKLAASVDETPNRTEWLKAQTPLELAGATRDAQARITLEHLEAITDRLTSFATGLGNSSRNRVHNVSLACQAIDGTVLLPGDIFSYNDTVGPRVASAGFKEAPVIVRGKLEKGTGGGICQVSSTLYNAVLLADLEIVRRRHHAFPVHYVPAGRDATVVDGVVDFRFKNRLAHPVAIDAKVIGGRVAVNIYGHPEDKTQVEILTGNRSTVGAGMKTVSDPKLPKGRRVVEESARSGIRVTVTRIVKKDGQEPRKEVVSRDFYRPFDGVVRVGTRVVAKPATTGGTPEKEGGTQSAPATTPTPPAPDAGE